MSQVTVSYANVRSLAPEFDDNLSRDDFSGYSFLFCEHVLSVAITVTGCLCISRLQYPRLAAKEGKNACMENQKGKKMKSLQHGVFPGGHPSKY